MHGPYFFFGGQHCCSRCNARRENKTPPPPQERISRYASPEKGIDYTEDSRTRMKNTVRWEPKKSLPVPLPLSSYIAMGTNRARSSCLIFFFLIESLKPDAYYHRTYPSLLRPTDYLIYLKIAIFCFQKKCPKSTFSLVILTDEDDAKNY